LVEPEKILAWCITLEKFEYTSEQRGGVGTRFFFEERAAGRLMKLNFEERAAGRLMKLNFQVTDWVENERLAFNKTSGKGVGEYEQRWTVDATASGSSFTFMEDIELPYGIVGKILGLVGRRVSEATVEKMLVKLKSLAEA
jgi:hypothetical protein